MLLYLIEDDLCQAKFLWKRIPDDAKAASPELARIWEVGKALFRRDPPAVHAALLTTEWSAQTLQYVNRLRGEDAWLQQQQ
jgi:COP9 signalosome complex subunit 8